MPELPQEEWTPAQHVYSAWLVQAREVHGSDTAVVAAMRRFLEQENLLDGLGDTWARKSSRLGGQFNFWVKGRTRGPQPPQKYAVRLALVTVVSAVAPHPPETVRSLTQEHGWRTFQEVVRELENQRESWQSREGKHSAESFYSAERARHVRQLVSTTPVAASDLDPSALNLGSWMYSGRIPPYVPRTSDSKLMSLITKNSTGIITVVGPPKSGKSRSVLETVASTVPHSEVLWINPAPGVLPALVELRREGRKQVGPHIVVLDDAQLLGLNPIDGLTAPRLLELAGGGLVIVIVHEHELATWRSQTNSRSATQGIDLAQLGATPELVEMLETHRVDYAPELDHDERAACDVLFEAVMVTRDLDFERLAEVLASVDHFKSIAHQELSAGGVRAALIEALIDAAILYPAGAHADQLKELCELHFRLLRPNLALRADRFQDAIEWAGSGYKGSPHAILIRAPGSDHHYRLFDALAVDLTTPARSLNHLLDLDLDMNTETAVGRWAFLKGQRDTAQAWWGRAAGHGHVQAMNFYGVLCYRAGDRSTARVWWERAANEHDLAIAMVNLGTSYLDDDAATAKEWFCKGVEHDHPDAMFKLGVVHQTAGDFTTARELWMRAANDHANAHAMIELGKSYEDQGDLKTARRWLRKAAEIPNAEAMFVLGVVEFSDDNDEAARTWWRQAAAHDMTEAMEALGSSYQLHGDVDTARTWWHMAARLDHADSMHCLGLSHARTGDIDNARSWWQRAANHGLHEAMSALGASYFQSGDVEAARSWWKQAANDHGDTTAMFNLGRTFDDSGDPVSAREWWKKAAALGDTDAMVDLGIADHRDGDIVTGRGWFEMAVDNNREPRAMLNLAVSFFNEGDLTGARRWWQQAATEHQHPKAMLLLGNSHNEESDKSAARSWWTKAAAVGSSEAQAALDELGTEK